MGIKREKNESQFPSQIRQREAWMDDVFQEVLLRRNSAAKKKETEYCGGIWDCTDFLEELETDILQQRRDMIVHQVFPVECPQIFHKEEYGMQPVNKEFDGSRKENLRAVTGLRNFYEESKSNPSTAVDGNLFSGESSGFESSYSIQGRNNEYCKKKEEKNIFSKRKNNEDISDTHRETRQSEESIKSKMTIESVKKDYPFDSVKVMIEVSSNTGETVSEIVEEKKWVEIKKRFPRLPLLIPEVNDKFRKVKHSLDAIKILLRCVLSRSYVILNWNVALEAYSAAKFYAVNDLVSACEAFFIRYPVPPEDAHYIYRMAQIFGVKDILLKSKKYFRKHINFSEQNDRIPDKICLITISMYPSQFCLPLSSYSLKTIDGAFSSDLRNDIEFEAINGIFHILGVEIQLQVLENEKGSSIPIYYEISNYFEGMHNEETVYKDSESLMAVNFSSKLLVRPGQKAKISILMDDLKLCNCYAIEKNDVLHETRWEKFHVRCFSNRKIPRSNQKRFVIGKLFYTCKG
ncbi:uncharacterized protein LOC118200529 [Stegodyphus dumicola]|uniref:uncharacterized protein LOC118200529 n=1 Tax=Stegodyphus dumicola TaxID=202533 RepID=UPI0015B25734|nr:uncharacterized protein LOC118200529 [Stegodyphus dumicola]